MKNLLSSSLTETSIYHIDTLYEFSIFLSYCTTVYLVSVKNRLDSCLVFLSIYIYIDVFVNLDLCDFSFGIGFVLGGITDEYLVSVENRLRSCLVFLSICVYIDVFVNLDLCDISDGIGLVSGPVSVYTWFN